MSQSRAKRLLLVNPCVRDKSFAYAIPRRTPVATVMLAMATMASDASWEVTLWDQNLTSVPPSPLDTYRLVVLCMRFFGVDHAQDIARQAHAAGCQVMMQGYYATFAPEHALTHADSIIIGEPESSWLGALQDATRGGLQPTYDGGPAPIDTLPRYDSSWLGPFDEERAFPVEASRGCGFRCAFCIEWRFHDRFRFRPIDDVLLQLEEANGRFVMFSDINIVSDPQYARDLFDAMAGAGVRWASQADIRIAHDPALLDAARESGCEYLFFGLETISQPTLKSVAKGWAKAPSYIEAIRAVRTREIGVNGSFIFGLDEDAPDTFARVRDLVMEEGIELPHFLPLTPIRGSQVRRKLEEEGRMHANHGENLDHHHVYFQPKRSSPEELETQIRDLWREVYAPKATRERLRGMTPDRFKLAYLLNTEYRFAIEETYGPSA